MPELGLGRHQVQRRIGDEDRRVVDADLALVAGEPPSQIAIPAGRCRSDLVRVVAAAGSARGRAGRRRGRRRRCCAAGPSGRRTRWRSSAAARVHRRDDARRRSARVVASPDADTPSYSPVCISGHLLAESVTSVVLTLQPVSFSNGVTQSNSGRPRRPRRSRPRSPGSARPRRRQLGGHPLGRALLLVRRCSDDARAASAARPQPRRADATSAATAESAGLS